ncbi:MAG: hypothetical protein AAFX87_26410 [Bacteroidota bacterium]
MRYLLISFLCAINFSLLAQGAETNNEEVHILVEQPAEPKGGIKGFYEYVNPKIDSSEVIKASEARGRLFLQFVVLKNGSIDPQSIRVNTAMSFNKKHKASNKKGVFDPEVQDAVMRIIKSLPHWTPGMNNNKPVNQKIVLPFTIGEK